MRFVGSCAEGQDQHAWLSESPDESQEDYPGCGRWLGSDSRRSPCLSGVQAGGMDILLQKSEPAPSSSYTIPGVVYEDQVISSRGTGQTLTTEYINFYGYK